jgi:hypothetical protein
VDLSLHLRVLARHRVLLAGGLTAAIVLALLSYVRIGPDGVQYRKQELWRSTTRLFVAEKGFPFRPTGQAPVDPTTFAVIASQFANSDAVMRMLKKDAKVSKNGNVNGLVEASPATDNNDQFLPFIDVSGLAPSAAGSQALAARAAAAISTYVQQRQAGVPERKRVTLQVVSRPNLPVLLQPRSKSATLFLFLGILCLTFIAVYVRENLRGGAAVDSRGATRLESAGVDSLASDPIASAAEQGMGEGATPLPLALPDGSRARQPNDEIAPGPRDANVQKGASTRWGRLSRADER